MSGRGASCNIVCTQPRRVAAVSVAKRVAWERDEKLGDMVGYQVRLDAKRSRNTRVLFCTTGECSSCDCKLQWFSLGQVFCERCLAKHEA